MGFFHIVTGSISDDVKITEKGTELQKMKFCTFYFQDFSGAAAVLPLSMIS